LERLLNPFDSLREHMFEQLFGLDEDSRLQLAEIARRRGLPDDLVQQLLLGGIRAGMTLGAAHPIDVKPLVEPVLFHERAQSVTLHLRRWPHDETGHLSIEVLAVEPATDA
jgi:hypothetical protein